MISTRSGHAGRSFTCLVAAGALASLAAPDVAADPPRDAFRIERPLTASKAGPTRAEVDVALLSGAVPGGALHDLRIFDDAGREVPYLLVSDPPAEPRWLAGRLLPISSARYESGFELDLGRVVHVDRLRLAGLPAPLLKRARVEGSGDRSHYDLLVGDVTLFDLPEEGLRRVEVDLVDVQWRYLRLTWDDRASTTMPIPAVVDARLVTPTTPPSPLRTGVPFERRTSRAGTSRFRITLPAERLPLTAVELECGGGHLLREARVVEPQLQDGEVRPVMLGSGTLRRAVRGELSAASLAISIDGPRGALIELVVDDGDNPPLDLKGVTAVMAPQPWIFFEAATAGQALLARVGNPSLSAPRYDLEATRDSLPRLRPSRATWGDARPAPGAPPAAEAPPTELALGGAAIDATVFAHTRDIALNPAPRGLNAVALDAAVLAHSRMLQDLRIADDAGHQVPYLLERRDEPTLVDLALQRVPSLPGQAPAPHTSIYKVTLPYESLPDGRLVIVTAARVFRRHVQLLAPRPADASSRLPQAQVIAERDFSHADPESAAGPLILALPTHAPRELFLTVDEGDNTPLPLGAAHLELDGFRLRFFPGGATRLSLLYGQPALDAPSYDLSLLARRLAGANADEVSLGPEVARPPSAPPARAGMTAFWIALVAAVVILLGLMAMLLRKEGTPGAARQ